MARFGGSDYFSEMTGTMAKSLAFFNHLSPLFSPGEDLLEKMSDFARNTILDKFSHQHPNFFEKALEPAGVGSSMPWARGNCTCSRWGAPRRATRS